MPAIEFSFLFRVNPACPSLNGETATKFMRAYGPLRLEKNPTLPRNIEAPLKLLICH